MLYEVITKLRAGEVHKPESLGAFLRQTASRLVRLLQNRPMLEGAAV